MHCASGSNLGEGETCPSANDCAFGDQKIKGVQFAEITTGEEPEPGHGPGSTNPGTEIGVGAGSSPAPGNGTGGGTTNGAGPGAQPAGGVSPDKGRVE